MTIRLLGSLYSVYLKDTTMPSVIIPPGFAQVFFRFRCTGDNEEMLTSIGVRTTGSPPDPSALAVDMADAWLDAWPASDLSNTFTFWGTRVFIGNDGDPIIGETTGTTAGTGSNAALPNNCAILMQKRTALGGRRNRGRCFIPSGYLPEIGVDQAGVIAGGTLTSLSGNASDLFTRLTSGGVESDQVVVLHSSSPSTPTPVTALTIAGKIATQRTRMRR